MALSARAATVLGGALSVTALMLVPVTAQAAQVTAASGWTAVFSHHYGAADSTAEYFSVIAPGNNDAWAFGGFNLTETRGTPVAEHWDGTAWSASALPKGLHFPIGASSADSPSDVWAVTTLGGWVLHWTGTWTLAEHLPGGEAQLTGVTALSPTDVWVFGGGGAFGGLGTWHFDGTTWTKQTGNAVGINSASALSPTDIWAIGSTSEPQSAIVHYNGITWKRVKTTVPSGQGFHDILAMAPNDVWLLTSSTNEHLSGTLDQITSSGTTVHKLPWPINPIRLASDGNGGFWMTAGGPEKSWAVHWSVAAGWSRTAIAAPGQMFGIALDPGTTSLWASGDTSTTPSGSDATIWAHGTP